MDKTIHCSPNLFASLFINSGFFTAYVLIATLSAPAFNKRKTSSIDFIPPPAVIGTKTFLQVSFKS